MTPGEEGVHRLVYYNDLPLDNIRYRTKQRNVAETRARAVLSCLTAACKAFSLADAKEKGTDGLVIRSLDD